MSQNTKESHNLPLIVRLPVLTDTAQIDRIDAWRRLQPNIPTRSGAVRELVDLGLATSAAGAA